MEPDAFFGVFMLGLIAGVLLTLAVIRASENRPPPDLWREDADGQ